MGNLRFQPTVYSDLSLALLLKEITHFCYAHTWYVLSVLPKRFSVSDCRLQTL